MDFILFEKKKKLTSDICIIFQNKCLYLSKGRR